MKSKTPSPGNAPDKKRNRHKGHPVTPKKHPPAERPETEEEYLARMEGKVEVQDEGFEDATQPE